MRLAFDAAADVMLIWAGYHIGSGGSLWITFGLAVAAGIAQAAARVLDAKARAAMRPAR